MLQAKWLGISIVLHLALLCGIAPLLSRVVQRAPQNIELVLDNLVFAETPQGPRQAGRPRIVSPKVMPLPVRHSETIAPKETVQGVQPQDPGMPVSAASQIPAAPAQAKQPASSPATQLPPQQAAASPSRQSVAPAAVTPVPTADQVRQRYMKEHFIYIRDLITGRLVYPPQARRMGWSGKVRIAFTIAEDGTAHDIRVVQSSGFPLLDKSALDTVRNTAPFPRPPVRADITVPISFSLQ